MGITDNLGLSTYNTASGSATTFLEFRLAIAGTESNMEIIDEYAGWVSGSIVGIQSNLLVNVNASVVSSNYYEATVSEISSYLTDSMIALKVNVSNTGSVTLNINELGTITLKKIGDDGELTNLEVGDLKADRHTLFVYDGTYYVLMGATTADQVNIFGNEDNFVSISGSGTLQDSGISGSSVLQEISGSGIMSDTSGSVVIHNESGIISGSYNKVDVDDYGHIISGSQLEYQTESEVWGSGIMSGTSGSTVEHDVSAITSGSYNKVEVDDYGHVTAGSQIETGASDVSYTPDTLTNWDSDADPGNTDGALDQLAERVADIESKDVFVATSVQTVEDTTTETTLIGSGVGSLTFPENYFSAGRAIKVSMRGQLADTGLPDMNVRLKLDDTLITSSGSTALSGVTDVEWLMDLQMTCRGSGSSGSFIGGGLFDYDGTEVGLSSASVINVDTTGSHVLDITWEWGTADAANIISCQETIVEMIDPNL